MTGSWVMWPLLAMGWNTSALLPAGNFHGNEVDSLTGESWLALRVKEGQAALVPTRLRVEAVRDELLDAPGQATGKQVSSTVADALVFLRGAGLRAGQVELARDVAGGHSGRPHHDLRLGATAYRIRTHCVPTGVEQEQQRFSCELRLDSGVRRQVLARMDGYAETAAKDREPVLGDDANPHLIFAGDLDRDGRLDLVFDITDHYNVSRPTLFLSSQAGQGELVRQMAQFESVGC